MLLVDSELEPRHQQYSLSMPNQYNIAAEIILSTTSMTRWQCFR